MIYILLIWLWPIAGIVISITFAVLKTRGDNVVIRFIGICLGFLAGIPLGPFAIYLFLQSTDSKGHAG